MNLGLSRFTRYLDGDDKGIAHVDAGQIPGETRNV